MDRFYSPNMPEIPYSPPIGDLFGNFFYNWATLSPVLTVLFGILFAAFLAKKIKNKFFGDDDDK